MKILQLVQRTQRRGAEVFAYQLSKELRNQAHTVGTAYLYPHRGEGGLSLQDNYYRNIGNPQDWVHGWQRRLFYRRIVMPQLDGVVGVSQATLNGLKTYYDLSIPMRNIPNRVEIRELLGLTRTELRRSLQTPEDASVMLFVGSLSSEKRVQEF